MAACLFFWIFINSMLRIYKNREADMVDKIDMFDEAKRPLENITMQEFNNSLKFFWGIVKTDEPWDVLNNPYIEFTAH